MRARAPRQAIPIATALALAAIAATWFVLRDTGSTPEGKGAPPNAEQRLADPTRAAGDPAAARDPRSPAISAPHRLRAPSPDALFDRLSDAGDCTFGPVQRCVDLQPALGACGRNDAKACLRIAASLRDEIPGDFRAALAFTGRACSVGHTGACAEVEETRRLVEQVASDDEAFHRALEACQQGDPRACHAVIERHQWDDPPSLPLLQALRRMCELGHVRSHGCTDVALRDPDRAGWALERACTIGSPDGCYLLARHHLGEGVHPPPYSDLDAALRAYARACELAPAHTACDEQHRARAEGGLPE